MNNFHMDPPPFEREPLQLYGEREGEVLVGIKGKYLCKPRWYKLRTTKRGQLEYVVWKGRRVYMSDIKLSEEYTK